MAEKKKTETGEESKKNISAEVENILKDVWGKVVEYASMGAEEATKVSSTAKMKVDIETLKFKRGKMAKLLGERVFSEWERDSSISVPGTRDTLRQIKKIDREVIKLEKDITRSKTKTKSKAGKKTAARKPAARKPAAKKAAPEAPAEEAEK